MRWSDYILSLYIFIYFFSLVRHRRNFPFPCVWSELRLVLQWSKMCPPGFDLFDLYDEHFAIRTRLNDVHNFKAVADIIQITSDDKTYLSADWKVSFSEMTDWNKESITGVHQITDSTQTVYHRNWSVIKWINGLDRKEPEANQEEKADVGCTSLPDITEVCIGICIVLCLQRKTDALT